MGAAVMGPKSIVPSWICCATSRSPPSAPEWWWMILSLPPVSSVTLATNWSAARVVPCLAGLTLPIVISRVCALTGPATASVTSAAAAAFSHPVRMVFPSLRSGFSTPPAIDEPR